MSEAIYLPDNLDWINKSIDNLPLSNYFKSLYLPHCLNCNNRKDPQLVFNSTILTLAIIAISFMIGAALNTAIKETFEKMSPKSEELSAKWNYAVLITFAGIIVVFLLMYNLNGVKW